MQQKWTFTLLSVFLLMNTLFGQNTLNQISNIQVTIPNREIKVRLLGISCPNVNDGFSNDEDVYGRIYVYSSYDFNGSLSLLHQGIAWIRDMNSNVKVKNSLGPDQIGAYKFRGSNSDRWYIENNQLVKRNVPADTVRMSLKMDLASRRKGRVVVGLDLCDEEFNKCRSYERRTIALSFDDVLKYLDNKSTFKHIDFDLHYKLFKLETREVGQNNSLVLWFDIEK
jgi:hypothetical protein